jgi:hypothetical protein
VWVLRGSSCEDVENRRERKAAPLAEVGEGATATVAYIVWYAVDDAARCGEEVSYRRDDVLPLPSKVEGSQ